MSKASVQKKIQQKAKRRAGRKLPVPEASVTAEEILEPLANLDVVNGESVTEEGEE